MATQFFLVIEDLGEASAGFIGGGLILTMPREEWIKQGRPSGIEVTIDRTS